MAKKKQGKQCTTVRCVTTKARKLYELYEDHDEFFLVLLAGYADVVSVKQCMADLDLARIRAKALSRWDKLDRPPAEKLELGLAAYDQVYKESVAALSCLYRRYGESATEAKATATKVLDDWLE